jgi:predicted O-methyltransferase YrrM
MRKTDLPATGTNLGTVSGHSEAEHVTRWTSLIGKRTKVRILNPVSRTVKLILGRIVPLLDFFCAPFTLCSGILLLMMRKIGMWRFKLSKTILMKVGIFPIRDHYTEPLFNPRHLIYPLDQDRVLPGIDLNTQEQLNILSKFHFNIELIRFPLEKGGDTEYYYHNGQFEAGDAEYWYSMIRLYKPKRIIEIGCGYSTLMAINARLQNKREDADYRCKHICIEPYGKQWLEQLEVTLIRELVEKTNTLAFAQLEAGDILFIDSSHIIRPQGDVLFEVLEILPILRPGVLVHFHDIFTPRDYPKWKFTHFFNEQYLVEGFLTFNREFQIIGALNYLKYHWFDRLASKCPILKNEPDSEPGSFWLVKK